MRTKMPCLQKFICRADALRPSTWLTYNVPALAVSAVLGHWPGTLSQIAQLTRLTTTVHRIGQLDYLPDWTCCPSLVLGCVAVMEKCMRCLLLSRLA